jgi:hypothetical protein
VRPRAPRKPRRRAHDETAVSTKPVPTPFADRARKVSLLPMRATPAAALFAGETVPPVSPEFTAESTADSTFSALEAIA